MSMSSTSQLEAQAAEYERRAEEAEASPVPIIIQVSKVVAWIFYIVILLQAILLTVAFFLRLFGAGEVVERASCSVPTRTPVSPSGCIGAPRR